MSPPRMLVNAQRLSKVENAFQALSLDEPRASFRPALWERLEDNKVLNPDNSVKNAAGVTVRPPMKVLPEEPVTGSWERHLLAFTRG
ncbi:peptidoglycan binding domain-containing protein [Diaporthe helianthi]|uniref:Peptidoglycan binding domain-containing protein n=1 Tax=Diaporthe helianthi TaxID=158607 RepID=A0A2P5HEG3_DIAHE|nr:peptidoglycan binding domain-containing protein [Diaporthe helianthi]